MSFTFQVMQFGRIDGNAYMLDFQYPLTALQAFAVAQTSNKWSNVSTVVRTEWENVN